MRPVEFAPEAIIQAGKDLQAVGRNITGFALRQKVGGGDPARLRQVWNEHIASQSVAKTEPVAELPVEVAEEVATVTKALTERLAALAVELNDKAVKAAERKVHEVVRSAGEQRAQAERELADASQTVDDLEAKLDEATSQVETLQAKLDVSQESNQAQVVELAQLRERLDVTEQTSKTASEQHEAELARMNSTIEAERTRYQQDIEKLRTELAAEKHSSHAAGTARDQFRADLATAVAKIETIEQQRVKADADLADERKATQAVKSECDRIRGELVKLQATHEAHQAHSIATLERLKKAEAVQEQSIKEVGIAREEAAKLSGQVEALQTQVSEQMRALSERQKSEKKQ